MSLDLEAVSALFSPERLRFARQLEGLTRARLAERAEVSPAAISQFESGTARPKAATVARLALGLSVPTTFLAGTGKPVLLPPIEESFFRSLRRSTPREREKAAAYAGLAAELAVRLEQTVSLPDWTEIPSIAVAPEADLSAAEQAADEVRALWGLGSDPIPHVVRTMERRGIVVIRTSLVSSDVDAFSWAGGGRPIVVLGADKGVWERSRLDASHELGHIVMHASDPEPGEKTIERQAQRFGSAFLVPSARFRDDWRPGRIDWAHLQTLRQKWGVSLAGLLYRAHEMELVTKTTYTNAMKYMSSRGWRTKEPGLAQQPERPALLERAIQLAADHGESLELLASESHLLAAGDLRIRLGLDPEPKLVRRADEGGSGLRLI